MIDGIISAVIDSASPAITRWRTAFVILSLLLVSPKFEKIFALNFLLIDLKESIALFSDLLASSNTLAAVGIVLCFYIILPYVNYAILKFFTFKSVGMAEPLLKKIDQFRKNKKEEIERIIEESFDSKKEVANSSIVLIDKYKEISEIAAMSFAMYAIASFKLSVFNLYIGVFLMIIYIVSSYIVASKILIVYLKFVAPFKVMEDYIKYFILVK